MKRRSANAIFNFVILVFCLGHSSLWSQQIGQPPAQPPSPNKTPVEQAEADAAKAKEDAAKAEAKLKQIQAENQSSAQKMADYLLELLKAANGQPAKDFTKEATRNQNFRTILDHLKKYPQDKQFLEQLRLAILTNPTQDPIQKLNNLYRDFDGKGMPPDEFKRKKQLLDRLMPELQRTMLTVTAKGTGRTTGHVADLNVVNPTQTPLDINEQTVYIPSDGQYQPYIGRIPPTLLYPGTTTIPVEGYCADVHTPPVPNGTAMPPIEEWIPVGIPETPILGGPIDLISTTPVPPFVPENIPDIISTSGFKAAPPDADPEIIITWPGTDIPVGGTLDPNDDPTVYAPVIAKVMEEVEAAAESVTASGILPTPFSGDPAKEIQSSIQQVIWIYTAGISEDTYEKPAFTEKVYEQFEDNSGKAVTTLPDEQKEKLDSGIDDFWDVFTAVGVEAKVISESSPGMDLDPTVLATVSTPSCKCNSISYDLEVKRGAEIVHTATHTTPNNPKVTIADFAFGDSLDIKITNIRPNCACNDTPCPFYPAESTNPNSPNYTDPDETRPGKVDIEMANDPAGEISENSNCHHSNKSFNSEGMEYSFALKTKDEGHNSKAVFQKLRIKAYCQLEDCQKRLCARYIQLNFVTAN